MIRAAGLAFLVTWTLYGQSAAAPRFEVASIKLTPPDRWNEPADGYSGKGKITFRNRTLKRYIMGAYGVGPNQIAGGPPWLDSARFDIDAKAEQPIDDDDALMAMLSYFNPPGYSSMGVVNTPAWRSAEVPSTNGQGTAGNRQLVAEVGLAIGARFDCRPKPSPGHISLAGPAGGLPRGLPCLPGGVQQLGGLPGQAGWADQLVNGNAECARERECLLELDLAAAGLDFRDGLLPE